MKKTYKLQDLDCANCAAKMERAINAMPEVANATVSFMTQRMTIEFVDDSSEKEVMDKVAKAIRKVEPDCRVILK